MYTYKLDNQETIAAMTTPKKAKRGGKQKYPTNQEILPSVGWKDNLLKLFTT